jgi:uroporphyrinogen decarboxylase
MNRRKFLSSTAAAAGLLLSSRSLLSAATDSKLSHKERVDRALRGQDVDRPPFTFYHHYKRPTGVLEAQDHLAFHSAYKTDIVKVMNDFSYPQSTTGNWWELKPLDSPYPEQLVTLDAVRSGLNGDAYFIDTLYGPYMTAMGLYLGQPKFAGLPRTEEARGARLKEFNQFRLDNLDKWHDALEAITQSTINHIQKARKTGISGALVSVFNAWSPYGTVEDYHQNTRPYDKRIFEALADTKLTVLHLHNLERPYLGEFTDFSFPILQHSIAGSGIQISEVRKLYAQTLFAGVDEIGYEKLTVNEIRKQWTEAWKAAGAKYIAAPGCSVPNNSTPEELSRFPQALGIELA